MSEPEPEPITAAAALDAESAMAAEGSIIVADTTPVPEAIWVYDHTEICGNKMRVKASDLTTFENRMRGECPTCMMPLGTPRPATAEDW